MVFFVVFVVALAARPALAQEAPAGPRIFALDDRATISLTTDWVERRNEDPPPPNQLIASAPRLTFSQILVLENRNTYEVLKLGISENPFIGSNASALDAQMHARNGSRLIDYLFYFFFPPPRACLARAKSALEAARRAEEAQRESEKEERAPRKVSISQPCEFASTPLDFYAGQVGSGVALDSNGGSQGQLYSFYVPPMEQIEVDGKTFFVFEAQGQRYVERAQLDYFNLAEQLRGARADLFWAVGADNPFPFVRDPLRKNVQLFHVAYAGLTTTGNALPEFREKLRSIRFGR